MVGVYGGVYGGGAGLAVSVGGQDVYKTVDGLIIGYLKALSDKILQQRAICTFNWKGMVDNSPR